MLSSYCTTEENKQHIFRFLTKEDENDKDGYGPNMGWLQSFILYVLHITKSSSSTYNWWGYYDVLNVVRIFNLLKYLQDQFNIRLPLIGSIAITEEQHTRQRKGDIMTEDMLKQYTTLMMKSYEDDNLMVMDSSGINGGNDPPYIQMLKEMCNETYPFLQYTI